MRTWLPLQLAILLAAIGCQVLAQNKLVMCYYENWSQYRRNRPFFPEQINVEYCTHLVYSFAKLSGNRLTTLEWNEVLDYTDGLYKRFNDLKLKKPGLKTLLAVGGFTARSEGFSAMSATSANRQQFVSSAISWLREHNFDGLDIDWEYPGHAGQGGRPEDKANFALLVQDLRKGFEAEAAASGRETLLLTAAVAAGYSTVSNGYDIPALNRYLDYINVMTYDLHGSWDSKTGHNAALYTSSTDTENFSVSEVAENWINGGAVRAKTLVGLATYGRTFTLADPTDTGVGARATGPGTAGTYSGSRGFLTYYEICEMALAKGFTRVFDQETKTPYAYKGNQWITYDDVTSLQYKMTWLQQRGYAGVIVWAIELDDFDGNSCGSGKYPLLKAISGCLMNGVGCSPNDGGTVPPVTSTPTPTPTTTRLVTQPPTTTTVRPTTRRPATSRPPTSTRPPTTLSTRPTTATTLAPGVTRDLQCPADYGFFRDLHDCAVFWFCWAPYRWRYECPPGTQFDQRYFVCAFKSDCTMPLLG